MTVAKCTKCAKPAHPNETDDLGRCVVCMVAAGVVPIADLILCGVCSVPMLASNAIPAPPCGLCRMAHNPRCPTCSDIVPGTAAHLDAIVNQRVDDPASREMRDRGVAFTWPQCDALGPDRLNWLTTRLGLVIMLDAHGIIARRNV